MANVGAGEVLIALTALAKFSVYFPSPTWRLATICNSRLILSSGLQGHQAHNCYADIMEVKHQYIFLKNVKDSCLNDGSNGSGTSGTVGHCC